jgi:LPS sulfotransferase NodH
VQSYMIATTPRTGSQWLCTRLTEMGFGAPDEHLKHALYECEPLNSLWERHQRNGIYGVKVFMEPIERQVPFEKMLPPEGPHAYVYLTRDDLEQQAWSLALARRYGGWYTHGDRDLPLDDHERALAKADILEATDIWQRTFDEHGIEPLHITLEQSIADTDEVDTRICEYFRLALD